MSDLKALEGALKNLYGLVDYLETGRIEIENITEVVQTHLDVLKIEIKSGMSKLFSSHGLDDKYDVKETTKAEYADWGTLNEDTDSWEKPFVKAVIYRKETYPIAIKAICGSTGVDIGVPIVYISQKKYDQLPTDSDDRAKELLRLLGFKMYGMD